MLRGDSELSESRQMVTSVASTLGGAFMLARLVERRSYGGSDGWLERLQVVQELGY